MTTAPNLEQDCIFINTAAMKAHSITDDTGAWKTDPPPSTSIIFSQEKEEEPQHFTSNIWSHLVGSLTDL